MMATMQFVIFNLEQEEFGVVIDQLKEIIKPPKIVSIPNTPEYIEGIINLRGEVYPIFNLRKKFGFPEKPFDDDTKIIIVTVGDTRVGFVVDEVSEIIRLEQDAIEKAPKLVSDVNRRYISGVGKLDERMIIMLDLNLILNDDEKEQVKNVEKESDVNL